MVLFEAGLRSSMCLYVCGCTLYIISHIYIYTFIYCIIIYTYITYTHVFVFRIMCVLKDYMLSVLSWTYCMSVCLLLEAYTGMQIIANLRANQLCW